MPRISSCVIDLVASQGARRPRCVFASMSIAACHSTSLAARVTRPQQRFDLFPNNFRYSRASGTL
jgi:hypothetical protein